MDYGYAFFVLCLHSALCSGLRMSSLRCDHSMLSVYDSLASELVGKRGLVKQHWVGIAGGPGSGKSTLAAAVALRVNELCNAEVAVVLPMDGFHFSRAELRSIAEGSAGKYSFEDLIARRGSPWTFDAEKIVASLSVAKSLGRAVLPTYSRQLSDPVEGGVELKTTHEIILCEGNYLFNFQDAKWAGLAPLFDEKWFISCADFEAQRQRLISRHLETWSEEKTRIFGPGAEGAARKADSNDVLNAQFIEQSKSYADRVIVSL